MIWLLLSVCCSAWLVICFKLFEKMNLDATQSIAANYYVCVLTAWMTSGKFPLPANITTQPWFPYTTLIGLSFVSVFILVALTVKHISVTMGGLMQKMSLLISVLFAFWYYHEPATYMKILGVAVALIAIVLTNIRPKTPTQSSEISAVPSWAIWLLPLATFIGSGIVDIGIAYAGRTLSNNQANPTITAAVFASAGTWGFLWLLFHAWRGTIKLHPRNIIGGLMLGVPNYGSIYFLFKAQEIYPSSVVFPVANLGVILLTTAIAIVFFNERMSKINIIGIVLALVAIALLSL